MPRRADRLGRPGRLVVPLSLLLAVAALLPAAAARSAAAEEHPGAAASARASAGPADARAQARRARRPNVVVVMADDMRVDDLDFAPHVRRVLGRHGLTFENSFSPYPLCCPARASFLTGMYAHNHGVYWHEAPQGFAAFDDSRTIATALRGAGYRTGFVGKYLNGYGKQRSRVTGRPSLTYVPRGWDDWRAAVENPGGGRVHGDTYDYMDTPFNVNGRLDNSHRGEYQTDVIGDFSLAMVRRFSRSDRPFFLYASYVAPHFGGPREPDDPRDVRDARGTLRSFRTPARPAWVRGRFDSVVTRASGLPRDGGPAEADISDKPAFFSNLPEVNVAERRALRELTRQRAEAVFVLDRQVGRLVRELRRLGEWRDTVLMFTSDNGYFLGEHRQREGKVRAHEPSLRVPFLVTGPGMREKDRRYDPISTVDVTATILDLAGARAPRRSDGASKVASMRQGDVGWSVPVVTESTHTSAGGGAFGRDEPRTSIGLRTLRWSYTRYSNGSGELYDLDRDPGQMDDVFDDRRYADVVATLQREWRRFQDCGGEGCRAPLPEGLSAGPAEQRALTRHYWTQIDRVYGRP